MSLFQAFLLGVVQGLTEFLPVSSSAHLVFTQHLLGFAESLVFFDVILHLGTLAGLLVFFAADIASLLRDSLTGVSLLLRRKSMEKIAEIAPYSRWALGILVASVPTALMGFLFKDWFESLFGSLRSTGFFLFGTTAILALTKWVQPNDRRIEQARYWDFLIIGLLQGVAIAPGISRSGATIAAALFRGLRREDAFRFSFLLSIPAILGAGLLEWGEGFASWPWGWPALGVGFLVSAVVGYLSLHFLARITRQGKLHWFGLYTLLLGLLIILFAARFE